MASSPIILLTLTTFLFLIPSTLSQSAPAPGPAGPINITKILEDGGQFQSLIRFLNQTLILTQLPNQLNNSNQGMTLFAPTDNAFLNLPAGTFNGLSQEDKVKLALYHVLPKYYSMDDLVTVSNPVQTQAGNWGLNFTGRANQVNVSTGAVETQINNALRKDFPFAVYVIDKVLLPVRFSDAPAPEASSTPTGKPATAPSSQAADGGSSPAKNDGGRTTDIGLGLIGGVVMLCMASLF